MHTHKFVHIHASMCTHTQTHARTHQNPQTTAHPAKVEIHCTNKLSYLPLWCQTIIRTVRRISIYFCPQFRNSRFLWWRGWLDSLVHDWRLINTLPVILSWKRHLHPNCPFTHCLWLGNITGHNPRGTNPWDNSRWTVGPWFWFWQHFLFCFWRIGTRCLNWGRRQCINLLVQVYIHHNHWVRRWWWPFTERTTDNVAVPRWHRIKLFLFSRLILQCTRTRCCLLVTQTFVIHMICARQLSLIRGAFVNVIIANCLINFFGTTDGDQGWKLWIVGTRWWWWWRWKVTLAFRSDTRWCHRWVWRRQRWWGWKTGSLDGDLPRTFADRSCETIWKRNNKNIILDRRHSWWRKHVNFLYCGQLWCHTCVPYILFHVTLTQTFFKCHADPASFTRIQLTSKMEKNLCEVKLPQMIQILHSELITYELCKRGTALNVCVFIFQQQHVE